MVLADKPRPGRKNGRLTQTLISATIAATLGGCSSYPTLVKSQSEAKTVVVKAPAVPYTFPTDLALALKNPHGPEMMLSEVMALQPQQEGDRLLHDQVIGLFLLRQGAGPSVLSKEVSKNLISALKQRALHKNSPAFQTLTALLASINGVPRPGAKITDEVSAAIENGCTIQDLDAPHRSTNLVKSNRKDFSLAMSSTCAAYVHGLPSEKIEFYQNVAADAAANEPVLVKQMAIRPDDKDQDLAMGERWFEQKLKNNGIDFNSLMKP